MTMDGIPGKRTFTIRLAGLQPGVRQKDFAVALNQLYRGKTVEQVLKLLSRLPLVLARSVTEEQARKVHAFLKPRGAILKVTAATPLRLEVAKPQAEKPAILPRTSLLKERALPGGETAPRIERRAKPRVHEGIQIHPMGIGEILDRSFRLLRESFWLYFIIVFIPQGIFFLMTHGGGLIFGSAGNVEVAMSAGLGFAVFTLLAFLVFVVLQFWAQGALIHAVSETYLGHSTSIGGSYGAIRKRLGRLLGTMVLWGVLVFFGPFLAAIVSAILVPALAAAGVKPVFAGLATFIAFMVTIWMAIRLLLNWMLVDKVVVLEDKGWMKALRRSKELMNSRTEPGFWKRPKNKAGLILVLGFLIAVGIQLTFQLPGIILTIVAPGSLMATTVIGLLKIISTSLATVFTATAMILFYYDIRLRKEGFDLKMMAEKL
jgi:MFS family permease